MFGERKRRRRRRMGVGRGRRSSIWNLVVATREREREGVNQMKDKKRLVFWNERNEYQQIIWPKKRGKLTLLCDGCVFVSFFGWSVDIAILAVYWRHGSMKRNGVGGLDNTISPCRSQKPSIILIEWQSWDHFRASISKKKKQWRPMRAYAYASFYWCGHLFSSIPSFFS